MDTRGAPCKEAARSWVRIVPYSFNAEISKNEKIHKVTQNQNHYKSLKIDLCYLCCRQMYHGVVPPGQAGMGLDAVLLISFYYITDVPNISNNDFQQLAAH